MHITLRQLAIFAAVARHESFTGAAKELNLTQPAVSMQMRQFEDQIGLAVSEQIGRRFHLTEAGEEVLGYARAVLAQLEEMETVLEGLKGMAQGRLRLAAISTANYFLPALLGRYRSRFPAITVSMDVTNRESILAQLANNEADLAIMGEPPRGRELDAEAFMDNPLVIVAPPEHRLAGAVSIKLSELEKESFLIREPGSGTRAALERFFRAHRLKLATSMELGGLETIKHGVRAGLGLGLLQRGAIDMEVEHGKLAILDVEGLPIMRQWFIVSRRGKRLSPAARMFKTLLTGEGDGKAGTG
ncbi:MAG TPA: LysR family transcriptional regulator [Rhodobacteraceae bacterium]|nr:LysR family transcriptional regulator [Paracoccaceae bacterium]